MAAARKYLVYIFLYFLFGGIIRSYVLSVTRLTLDEPLDTVVGLLNLSLAFRCILIGSACVFTIRLSNLLFQLYEIKVTTVKLCSHSFSRNLNACFLQPFAFPVVRCGEDACPLLQEAMTSSSPLLRLWACRDWCILAEQSAERRALIFSVSQPGNHPHNWNSVIAGILPQCLQFISELKGEVKTPKVEIPSPVAQSPPPYDSFASPVRMRSMALKSPVKTVQPLEKPESSQNKLQAKVQEMIENLKKKPLIHFLWGEIPDARRRQTFAKAEPIILLIEGV